MKKKGIIVTIKTEAEVGKTYFKNDKTLVDEHKKIIDERDIGHGVRRVSKDVFATVVPKGEEIQQEPPLFRTIDIKKTAKLWKEVEKEQKADAKRKKEEKSYDPLREAQASEEEINKDELERWQEQEELMQSKMEAQVNPKDKIAVEREVLLPRPASGKKKSTIEKLYSQFRILFNDMSWNNEIAGLILFHVIIGSILRNTRFQKGALEIDPRISFLWIQSSGSGKTSARRLIRKLIIDLGIEYKDVSEFTDAALVGTINIHMIKGSQVAIPRYGFLKEAQVIYMDDANDFIAEERTSKHALKSRKHIRDALNPIGNNEVSKDLRNGSIGFYPDCSVIGTSYWFPGFIASQDNSGFFQRFIIYTRSLTSKDREDNMAEEKKRAAKSIAALHILNQKRQQLYDDLFTNFQRIDGSQRTFVFDSEAIDYIFEVSRKSSTYISYLGRIKQFATEFLDRTRNYLYIFALHSAAIDNRAIVRKKDVEYAVRIVVPLFREAIAWFEGAGKEHRSPEEKAEIVAYKFFKDIYEEMVASSGGNKILKAELFDKVSRASRKSLYTIRYSWYPLVVSMFVETSIQTGRKRFVYLEKK